MAGKHLSRRGFVGGIAAAGVGLAGRSAIGATWPGIAPGNRPLASPILDGVRGGQLAVVSNLPRTSTVSFVRATALHYAERGIPVRLLSLQKPEHRVRADGLDAAVDIDDTPAVSAGNIRATLGEPRLPTATPSQVLLINYYQLLRAPVDHVGNARTSRFLLRQQELDAIGSILKRTAADTNTAIIALSMLSGAPGNVPPTLHHADTSALLHTFDNKQTSLDRRDLWPGTTG